MQIDTIDDIARFRALRQTWERVYAADPEAQFFSSWAWLERRLEDHPSPWFVLAARTGAASPYVAFLPLRMLTRERPQGGFTGEINMAAAPIADYTGLLCRPACERTAIPALAEALQRRSFGRFLLPVINTSQERLGPFFESFDASRYEARSIRILRNSSGINSHVCPYAQLAGDWEAYLDRLGASTRQKARRFLRKIDSGELRVSHADDQTVARDVDLLLDFWQSRWQPIKGERTVSLVRILRRILLESHEAGYLHLPVLWQGDRALGAIACLVDRIRGSMLFFIGSRDETVRNPPAGFVLHAHAMRHATRMGCGTYDFLRGDEPYKLLFASATRPIRNIELVSRRPVGALDPLCVPEALRQSLQQLARGEVDKAAVGLRQVQRAAPQRREAALALAKIAALRHRRQGTEAVAAEAVARSAAGSASAAAARG